MRNFFKILFLIVLLNLSYSSNAKNNIGVPNLLLPSATITVNSTSVCKDGASPIITFTGKDGTAPYTFTYKIGTGANIEVVSTGNSAALNVPTSSDGVFIYNLVSVKDSSGGTQPLSESVTVTVNPLPVVDFTFNNDDTCSGTTIQFTDTTTGTGSYTYLWDFGKGDTSTLENPVHTFTELGCGTIDVAVKLTVTGGGCTVVKTKTIKVRQKPDIGFVDSNNSFEADFFTNCGNASLSNTSFEIKVGNISKTTCASSYSINWGDGSIENNISLPLSHVYTKQGVFSMIISVTGANGCSNAKNFLVKNILNPSGGILSPGGTTDMCIPTPVIQYTIGNWATNSPGTIYSIDYGDGSPIVKLSQDDMIKTSYYNASNPSTSTNYPVPYSYTTSSCPRRNFTIRLTVTNACKTTQGSVDGGNTIATAIADFTTPPTACTTTNILFTNTSTLGYSSNCLTDTIFTWDFGDPASGSNNTINTGIVNIATNANHIFSAPGTYTVKLTASSGGKCISSASKTQTICISSPPSIPTISLTPSKTTNCIPLAVNASSSNINVYCASPNEYSWIVTKKDLDCDISAADPTYLNGTTSTSQNPVFNFTAPGEYSIRLQIKNSCGEVQSSIQKLIVRKPPKVTVAPIANLCGGNTGTTIINPTATIQYCGFTNAELVYNWSFPGGSPATSIAIAPQVTYTSGGSKTVSLFISVVGGCADSVISSTTFVIGTAPALEALIPTTQTICSGSTTSLVTLSSTPVGATFSWTATATAGITGFTRSGTNIISEQTISTTNTSSGTVTYAITPILVGCPSPSTNYVITVNPAPTLTTQPNSSTICIGGTPNVLSFTISGATGTPTYQWYSNTINSNIGGTLILGQTNDTFNPPASVTGTFYYYCIITLPTGGCSNIKTNTATVAILSNASITAQPTASQNLCVGVSIPSPLSISYSGGTGTVSYQWYSNTTNASSGGLLISGATTAAYTPPVFTIAGNYYYYATVSLNGNSCLPTTSNTAEVIVFADPTISSQPLASQTLCQGVTPLNLDVTASGGNGTFSYQWYSNSNNSYMGSTLITGATKSTYLPPTNTVGTKYYYCVVDQNSTSGCSVSSAIAAIIVISAPTITQAASSTVCQGGNPTPLSITVSGASGTPTYQWYSNTINNTTTGTAISGETNTTYIPSALTVGTTYYYCIITLPSGGCSSITTNTATVTINNGATIDTQPTLSQSICIGATTASPLTVRYSGGSGSVSYQWYSNTINSNTGGILIPNATNSSYTPAVFTTSGSFYYYATLSFSGNGCGSVTSNPAEIIVVPDPTVSSQPLILQTLCQGAPATSLSVVATGGIGAYSYQWFSSTTNSNVGGILISGETNNAITPPTMNVGSIYYYCVIAQTSIGCGVTSATAKVTINQAPAFTTTLTPSTICLEKNPSLLRIVTNSDSFSPNYQWYSNTTNLNSGGILLSGETSVTFNPPNSIVGTTYYYCVVNYPSITGNCSEIISSPAEIIINPNPVISNKTALICSDRAFTITPDTLGGAIVPVGTTYTWTNPTVSPSGSITGASAQAIAQTSISQNLINNTASTATVTYTVKPLSGVCTGANFTIVVTVNPAISPNVTSTNSPCFGVNKGAIQTNIKGGIPFSSGVPYLISWTGPNGFTSSLASISNLAPGDYSLSITDAGGCPIANTYTITEPADLSITTDIEKDITCFNAANGEIKVTITGGTLNYSYAWTKNGTAFANTEDLSNLSPGNYIVTISDTNACSSKIAAFTITEPPILAVNLVGKTEVLCYGQATGAITVNVVGGTAPYIFAWSGPNSFTNSNQNLTAIFAGTYILIVTDNSGCTKNLSVQITQTPEIKITATTTPIICYGGNDASIALTITGGITPYTIGWSNLGSGTFQDNLSAGDYLITVTDAHNCTKSLNVNIPEAPIFTVNPVVKNISCFGANNGSIALNFVGGIGTITLTWNDGAVTGTTRNNLKPGTYTVTIVDGKPCTIKRTFIILEPQLLVVTANSTHALDCDNANSGAINLLVSGGSTPYTYAWSNGAVTEDLANISAGNYLVTVTDANGCSKQAQYSINRPPPIATIVVTKTDFDCDTKTVKQTFVADVSGGVPPYQLVWSNGTVSGANNEIMNTTQNGTVILNATDALGCKSNATFTVAIPELGTPSFSLSSFAYTNYGNYSINDPITFTNTTSGDFISMIWDFGDGTSSTDLNPVHTFTTPKDYVVSQTVTYPFGCVYVQKITIILGKGYMLVVPTAFTPNSDRLNDTFKPVTKSLKKVRLDVYDTWGSMIYSETGDALIGWNGKIKDSNAENGNYYCKVSGETFYGTIVNENHPFVLIK